MSQRLRTRLRPCLLPLIALLFFLVVYLTRLDQPEVAETGFRTAFSGHEAGNSNLASQWHSNLFLDEDQCVEAFPGLTKEIERAIDMGPFDLPLRSGAMLQAKIEDGRLYIVRAPKKSELSAIMRHRQSATMNQLYRALITSPSRLPNTSFALVVHDHPMADTFSYARTVSSPSGKRVFPMPHFSFWSWPLPFIGSLPASQRAVAAIEAATPFSEKDPRAVWRGTAWFNNGAGPNPRLRQELLKVAGDASWADVQKLEWETNAVDASNALNIEDFCRYRYIIHTEGIGYSGRLQFHQQCESVILSPPLEWMQHTSHLIRPIFSSTLLNGRDSTSAPQQQQQQQHPSDRVREQWPVEYGPDEANMVFVAGDWSDLESTVRWLENHPHVAAGIARRQKLTYVDEGYLSPAAEVCYWRALLRGWSKVARPTGDGWEEQGVPFEEFATGKQEGH